MSNNLVVVDELALPDFLSEYEVERQVTRTVLQQISGVPFFVQFESPSELSKMNPEYSRYKNDKGEPVLPDVANVINLSTGELQILIMNAVLKAELEKAYPDGGYAGRTFGIRRQEIEPDDKRRSKYALYQIKEFRKKTEAGRTVEVEAINEINATTAEAIDNAKVHRVKRG